MVGTGTCRGVSQIYMDSKENQLLVYFGFDKLFLVKSVLLSVFYILGLRQTLGSRRWQQCSSAWVCPKCSRVRYGFCAKPTRWRSWYDPGSNCDTDGAFSTCYNSGTFYTVLYFCSICCDFISFYILESLTDLTLFILCKIVFMISSYVLGS